MRIDTEVAILGGGFAGLWLGYELAKRGRSTLIVDQKELGAFCSTRNLGWLHSGAVFAALGKPEQAAECHEGYLKTIRVAGECGIVQKEPDSAACYLIFPEADEKRFKRAVSQMKGAGAAFAAVNEGELTILPSAERTILAGGLAKYAILTSDRSSFDTRRFLVGLSERYLSLGGDLLLLENSLKELTFGKQGEIWQLDLERIRIHARIVVLCCGALIPDLLVKLATETDPNHSEPIGWMNRFERCRIAVAVLHQRVCDSILAVPYASGPTLVPFAGGAAFCVTSHKRADSHSDLFVTAQDAEEIRLKLTDYFPGLAAHTPIEAHFYSCLKLNILPVNGGRQEWFDHSSPPQGERSFAGVFSFCPDRFTSAPVQAAKLADAILGQLGVRATPEHVKRKEPRNPTGSVLPHPRIATRLYYERPTHILERDVRATESEKRTILQFTRTDHKSLDYFGNPPTIRQ